MGAIKQMAVEEVDLEEFENTWQEWRKVSQNITASDEYKIRNLHASFAFMLSHKQMQLSIEESIRDAQKVKTDLVESYLMACDEYKDSAVTIRKMVIRDDIRFKEQMSKLTDLNMKVTVIQGEVNALFTSVSALSRELSARLKG